MFGASRSVAGSHLINLRRQRASFKSRGSVTSNSPDEYPNTNNFSDVKQYVIPNFARFEFCPKIHRSRERNQVKFALLFCIIILFLCLFLLN